MRLRNLNVRMVQFDQKQLDYLKENIKSAIFHSRSRKGDDKEQGNGSVLLKTWQKV